MSSFWATRLIIFRLHQDHPNLSRFLVFDLIGIPDLTFTANEHACDLLGDHLVALMFLQSRN